MRESSKCYDEGPRGGEVGGMKTVGGGGSFTLGLSTFVGIRRHHLAKPRVKVGFSVRMEGEGEYDFFFPGVGRHDSDKGRVRVRDKDSE